MKYKEIDFKAYNISLNTLRAQIDIADQTILDTLGKRMKVALIYYRSQYREVK